MNGIHEAILDVTGATWPWEIRDIVVIERLDAPFAVTVECDGTRAGIPAAAKGLGALVGAHATLTLPKDAAGARRVVVGLVDRVERTWASILLTIVPIGAPKLESTDYHVDLDDDALTIATAFLTDAGLSVDARVTRTIPPRKQSVQAFETGRAYVDRLLAEEGIVWFADPDDATKVILADAPSSFPAHPGKFSASAHRGFATKVTGFEAVFDAHVRRRVRTTKVSLRDYKFENPALDLAVTKDSGAKPPLERYGYRGGYEDTALGKQLAALQLDAHRADVLTLAATTYCTTVSPGQVLTFESDDAQLAGKWLVTRSMLHCRNDDEGRRADTAQIEAVPAEKGIRPAVPATLRMPGIQTMTVTGAPGEEIHPDEHGRIKTLHRWDRKHHKDDKSSAWQRVVQPPMPGSMLVPRVGWEVIAGYFGRSAEAPFILGRLDTGKAPPAAALPAQKVVSAFGSRTTPGGGSFNGISYSDTKGGEGMNITASAAYNERTANDKKAEVKASCVTTIGADHTLTVGTGHLVGVDGAHSTSVAADRKESVTSNIGINAGSEMVGVGGARIHDIAGDQDITCNLLGRTVGGAKTVVAVAGANTKVTGGMAVSVGNAVDQTSGASWDVTVVGICKETVTSAKTVKCATAYELSVRASITESYASRDVDAGTYVSHHAGSALNVTSNGAANIKGTDVSFKGSDITIKASGITITIGSGGVKIQGNYKSSQSGANEEDEKY